MVIPNSKDQEYSMLVVKGDLTNDLPRENGIGRNNNDSAGSSRLLSPIGDALPVTLSIIPMNHAIIFPGMIVPIILNQERYKNTVTQILDTKEGQSNIPHVGIVALKDPANTKSPEKNLLPYGVVCRIIKRINLPDGGMSILLNCLKRFHIKNLVQEEPTIVANITYKDDIYFGDTETEALARMVVNQFKVISQENPLITEEMRIAMANVDGPGKLGDLLASILIRDSGSYLEFLEQLEVKKRLEKLLGLLKKEVEVHNLQTKLHSQINQNINKSQREFFLNEQLKLIQKELGHTIDEKTAAHTKFTERLAKLKPSGEASKKIKEELEKLENLNENSPEFGVTYNYLDWLTSLPWGISAVENLDIKRSRRILQRDHFGLHDVKRRILEFTAVRKLKNNSKGSIICLVGPPGVGKTSLGKSIARALNRPFFRFSVGGMRDEAEIRGHRRTYVGAMPGKIVQGLKRTGVNNPVFMIDEIDKMGQDYHGDPSSALLEVLDPEQNTDFADHYLDLTFDSSQILFICTANQTDSIPQALLDRMEVIRLPGYILEEKLSIAERYIVPKQLEKNGLSRSQLAFPRPTLISIIDGYAREAGVRNLEKWIEQICRNKALAVAEGKDSGKSVAIKDLEKIIGPPYFTNSRLVKFKPGISVGLAWTAMGGETLTIQSVAVPGKNPDLKLTGQMGNVMNESANIAWTYVKKSMGENKRGKKFISKNSIHLHIPAGAVPKDGPSAGISLATSLFSLVKGESVKPGLAITGELTLTGNVLPVGGIREKVIAAKRNGYSDVMLPKENARDLKEIPAGVKKGLNFHLVSNMNQVLRIAFEHQ